MAIPKSMQPILPIYCINLRSENLFVEIDSLVAISLKIRYVFFDTGLEYDASLRHISEVEGKYGVTIERIKPKKSIPTACREHGS